jgi:hypothetical protein
MCIRWQRCYLSRANPRLRHCCNKENEAGFQIMDCHLGPIEIRTAIVGNMLIKQALKIIKAQPHNLQLIAHPSYY